MNEQPIFNYQLLLLQAFFVARCQFPATLRAAASEYLAAIFGFHAVTEAVFVGAFSSRWLKCSFHRIFDLKFDILCYFRPRNQPIRQKRAQR